LAFLLNFIATIGSIYRGVSAAFIGTDKPGPGFTTDDCRFLSRDWYCRYQIDRMAKSWSADVCNAAFKRGGTNGCQRPPTQI